MIRWKSNNQRVADREIFTGRIRGGQLEIVPDPKTGDFVPVYLDAPPVNTPPEYSDTSMNFEVPK